MSILAPALRYASLGGAAPVTPTWIAPAGALLRVLGDSQLEYNVNAGSGATQRATGLVIIHGGFDVTHALARYPQAKFLNWNNPADSTGILTNVGRYYSGSDCARGGANLSQILDEINAASSLGDVIIINGSTNSLQTIGGTFQADHMAILTAARAKWPTQPIAYVNCLPVGISQSISPRTPSNILAANAIIASNVALMPGFFLIDNYTPYADAGTPGVSQSVNFLTIPYIAATSGDDLHEGPLGASTKGTDNLLSFFQAHVASFPAGQNAILARKVTSVLPAGVPINTGTSAINISTTGGTGATITGNVPTGMTLAFGSNFQTTSYVSSLSANAETGGQDWQIKATPIAGPAASFTGAISGSTLTASAITGAAPLDINQLLSGSGVSAGTQISARATAAATVGAATSGASTVTFQSLPGTAPIVGGIFTGTNIANGTRVTSYNAGTGDVGLSKPITGNIIAGQSTTYDTGSYTLLVNGVTASQTVASTAMTTVPTSEILTIRPAGINYAVSTLQSQWAEMYMEAEFDQGAGWGILNIQSGERSNNGNNFQSGNVGVYPKGSGNRQWWLVTPPMQYVAGSTGFQPQGTIRTHPHLGGGDQFMKIKRWDVQIIADPRFTY